MNWISAEASLFSSSGSSAALRHDHYPLPTQRRDARRWPLPHSFGDRHLFEITRSQARQFRSVVRKTVAKQTSSTGSKLYVMAATDGVRLRAVSHSTAVELFLRGEQRPDEYAMALETLDSCAGRTSDAVMIERADNRIVLRWTAGKLPRVAEYAIEPIEPTIAFPPRPEELIEDDPDLWSALRDAAKSADSVRSRFALDCIQLRGEKRQIVATDSRQALIQEGFNFPWQGDVLLLASNVLACTEIASDATVSIGRVDDWVAIARAPWTVWLRADTEGRFPEVEKILPETKPDTARLQLDPSDAEFLLAGLSKASSRSADSIAATIELNGQVIVRTKASEHARTSEIVLANSRAIGTPGTFSVGNDLLARAARLGFREIRFFGSEGRALCDDGRRKLVWTLLTTDCAVPASDDAVRVQSPTSQLTVNSQEQRSLPKVADETTRPADPAASENQQTVPVKRTRRRTAAIEQVVALRESLKAEVVHCNEIIRSLKQHKREARIVQSTLESLKQLQKVAS